MVLIQGLLDDIENSTQTRLNTELNQGAFGDDNTPPTAGDTDLGNEFFIDTFDEVDISIADEITKTIILGTGEGNGETIREVGAKDADLNLKIHALVSETLKTSDISFYVDFNISIEVVEV